MTNIDYNLLSPNINYQFYITSASPVYGPWWTRSVWANLHNGEWHP